ncbi:MAG: hypothetical protein J4A00_01880 [Gammaproteobacteria bacterium]|nr:hypothetical protein [Gammaproteobacteria bacterium]
MTFGEESAAQPLRVALEGVDDRARARLTRFLATISNDSCLVVEPPRAEVLLVNISGNASLSYEDFSARAGGSAPVVVLAHENPGIEESFYVPKPIQGKRLLQAIQSAQKLYWELTAVADQTNSEVTFSDYDLGAQESSSTARQPLKPERGLYYDPAQGLTGLIARAVEQADTSGAAYLVDFGSGRYLLYQPDSRSVGLTVAEHELKQLSEDEGLEATVRLARLQEVVLLEADMQEKGFSNQSLTAILWKTHAWHSAGRLPAGTEIDLRVVLSRWPNFTELLRLPNDMRIAHLWVEQPMLFTETAALLDLSAPAIYSLYSAAHAAGLAHRAHRDEDYLIAGEAMVVDSSRRGFFGRLASRLGRDKP